MIKRKNKARSTRGDATWHLFFFFFIRTIKIRQGTMLVPNTLIRLGDLGCIHS